MTALGRFGITSGGRAVAIPEGQPEQLVKLLAASRRRLLADEAIEALWPDADLERGRKRLRNVLNRLRTGAGELVVRDGESLLLSPGIEVDAIRFEEEAGRRARDRASPRAERAGPLRARALPRRAPAG